MKVLAAITTALVLLVAITAYVPAGGASAEALPPQPAAERLAVKEDAPEGESKDLPWVPILVLSLVIPAAALLVPSFLMGGEKEVSQVE